MNSHNESDTQLDRSKVFHIHYGNEDKIVDNISKRIEKMEQLNAKLSNSLLSESRALKL